MIKEKLTNLIESIEDTDLKAILTKLNEKTETQLINIIKPRQSKPKPCIDVTEYIKQLDESESRSKSIDILELLNRNQLIAIAKNYKIPYGSDKKAKIIERIVEFTIGSKLRHNAIKSLDLSYKVK